nr:MAG TPA: holin [Caudoviricetes sp.]
MAFGGWSDALITLIIFMSVDYITGLAVAGIFKKSKKSENGALESRAGFKGLCRKGVALLIVLIATRLDIMMNTTYIRDAVVIAFVANEGISIIENAGLMGVPIPSVVKRAIDVLKEKDGTPESR